MRFAMTTSLAALMAAALFVPASTTTADAGRGRNAAIAAGVILGVTAAAALSSSANASERRRWRNRCARLYRRCEDGSDWACEKFENSGCSY